MESLILGEKSNCYCSLTILQAADIFMHRTVPDPPALYPPTATWVLLWYRRSDLPKSKSTSQDICAEKSTQMVSPLKRVRASVNLSKCASSACAWNFSAEITLCFRIQWFVFPVAKHAEEFNRFKWQSSLILYIDASTAEPCTCFLWCPNRLITVII